MGNAGNVGGAWFNIVEVAENGVSGGGIAVLTAVLGGGPAALDAIEDSRLLDDGGN